MAQIRNNIKSYDPGLFRFAIEFWAHDAIPDDSGGTDLTFNGLLRTRAVREEIREGSQLAIVAGASLLNQDCYFVIRNRKWFYPAKDMQIRVDGEAYVLSAVVPINNPVTYLKLLCIKTPI